jgi:YggT family protein
VSIIGSIIDGILLILIIAFFGRAIISWLYLANVRNEMVSRINYTLSVFTEPIVAPLRRVIPPLGGMDLSFMAAVLLLIVMRKIVASVF